MKTDQFSKINTKSWMLWLCENDQKLHRRMCDELLNSVLMCNSGYELDFSMRSYKCDDQFIAQVHQSFEVYWLSKESEDGR